MGRVARIAALACWSSGVTAPRRFQNATTPAPQFEGDLLKRWASRRGQFYPEEVLRSLRDGQEVIDGEGLAGDQDGDEFVGGGVENGVGVGVVIDGSAGNTADGRGAEEVLAPTPIEV